MNLHNNRVASLGLAVVLTLPFTSLTAIAESAQNQNDATEDRIEELFVLGERRAYQGNFDYLENPSAVQLIDESLLRDAGVLSLDQALDLSASVARQNNFGGLWNSFSVRGFSGDINLPSGFLVNGFNAGRGFAGPRDIVGIESVEVLKGPRAALFGRGEPGGTINLVTKRPKFETAGGFRASYGRWDQLRFEGDAQTTLGANEEVGVRIVGFFEDADSFRETVETRRVGFYPSVTWNVSDATSLTYELEYTDQEIPFDRGVVFAEEFGFSPRRTFTGEPGDGPIDTEVLGHQLELQHNFTDNWSLLAGLGYRDTSLVGNATEPNFVGRQTFPIDGQTISRFFRSRDFDSEYFVARAEIAGEFDTGSLRHRLLVGADYDRFENILVVDRFRGPFFGTEADISTLDPQVNLFLDAFDPVFGAFPTPEPVPNVNTDEDLTGFGIYVQDQIDITDRLQVRLGLRWDDFDQDLINFGAESNQSDTRVSPQFGVVYLLNEGFSLYASYGEGFRQQTGADFQGNQFAPNVTESAEIGFKIDASHFFAGLSGGLTFTLFDVEQSNILVNDDRPEAQAVGFFSRSAGEAQSRGVELDANLSFDSGFNVWLSYAYTDAEFTNSNPDADFGALIEEGDPLINSPEHQVNLQVSQNFQVGNIPVQLGAGLLYTGERAGFTGFDFTLPSYTTVRFFGEARPTDNFAVRFDLDNAFNETFFTNSFADVWVQPGAPVSYRVSASYAF